MPRLAMKWTPAVGGRCFIGFSPEDVVDPFGRLEGTEPHILIFEHFGTQL